MWIGRDIFKKNPGNFRITWVNPENKVKNIPKIPPYFL
jgi:hypothetical protein